MMMTMMIFLCNNNVYCLCKDGYEDNLEVLAACLQLFALDNDGVETTGLKARWNNNDHKDYDDRHAHDNVDDHYEEDGHDYHV